MRFGSGGSIFRAIQGKNPLFYPTADRQMASSHLSGEGLAGSRGTSGWAMVLECLPLGLGWLDTHIGIGTVRHTWADDAAYICTANHHTLLQPTHHSKTYHHHRPFVITYMIIGRSINQPPVVSGSSNARSQVGGFRQEWGHSIARDGKRYHHTLVDVLGIYIHMLCIFIYKNGTFYTFL